MHNKSGKSKISKANGVLYLKKLLNIPFKEIVMSGDGFNDFTMAKLTKQKAHFICPQNATNELKNALLSLKRHTNKIYMAKEAGTMGILEGLSQIIK